MKHESIDCLFLERLLNEGESEYVDFKEGYYSQGKKIDFLHDILCMANSSSPNDRYVIFGVSDDKQIIGIPDTIFSNMNTADIVDWLRKVKLNKELYNYISLHKIYYDNKKIIILRIKNIPLKPFVLTQDYKYGGKILRTGVVYTRNRDTNTPINSAASDYETSLMWRERFGLDKKISEKALELLKDYDSWEYEGSTDSLYYNTDPDYKILNTESKQDKESILKVLGKYLSVHLTYIGPDKISREIHSVKYKGTEINIKATVISGLDNGRRLIPYPFSELDDKNGISGYYIKNDHELDICQIIQRHLFWDKESYGSRCINDYDVTHTITAFTKFDIK